MNFLHATGNIADNPVVHNEQEYYKLDTIVMAKTESFRFVKKWLDFEKGGTELRVNCIRWE